MGNTQSYEEFNSRAKMIFTGSAPKSAEFWTSLWISKIPAEEITKLITPDMIRAAKSARPNNLVLLLEEVVKELRTHNNGYPAILTSIDLLTRVIPFLLEPESPSSSSSQGSSFASKYLFATPQGDSAKPSLGSRLLHALLDLLFLPGFSVSAQLAPVEEGAEVPTETHCWAPGVGTPATVGGTAVGNWCACEGTPAYQRRIAVLRCLVACCAGPMFTELGTCADAFDSNNNTTASLGFLEELTRTEPKPLPQARALFCSLVNTVCSYDPVGWGLPYNHLVSSNVPERLVDYSLRLLMIILTYKHNISPKNSTNSNIFIAAIAAGTSVITPINNNNVSNNVSNSVSSSVSSSSGSSSSSAVKKEAAMTLMRTEEEQNFVYRGLARLLENTFYSASTYLPFSHTDAEFFREVLVVLFVLVLVSPAFREHCLMQDTFNRAVLVSTLYYIDACCSLAILGGKGEDSAESKRAHALRKTSGVSHLCALILLVLSENRLFAVGLNRVVAAPPPIQLPALPTRGATYADVLVLAVYKVFAAENYYFLTRNPTLVECLLSVLVNVSPYIKALSMPAAFKLLEAFTKLAEPRTLARPSGPSMLSMLLAAICNLVQYEHQGNLPVIYSVLRFKDELAQLHSMTYQSFQADLAKRKRNVNANGNGNGVPVAVDPNAEKVFNAWKATIPVGILVDIVKTLSPQIQRVCSGNADDQKKIMHFLEENTLVGLVPPPGPVVTRHYAHSKSTACWLIQLAWFVTYARLELNTFVGLNITLFKVIRKPSGEEEKKETEGKEEVKKEEEKKEKKEEEEEKKEEKKVDDKVKKEEDGDEKDEKEEVKKEESIVDEKKEEGGEEEDDDEMKPKYYEGKDD